MDRQVTVKTADLVPGMIVVNSYNVHIIVAIESFDSYYPSVSRELTVLSSNGVQVWQPLDQTYWHVLND